MKFNGTEKQNKWAEKILTEANLTDEQIDNLLKWAGPTLYSQGIMDAIIVINNRRNLSAYADSLGKFLKLSQAEKHAVAEEACGVVRGLASINISSAAAAIGRIGGSAKSERKAASSRENGKLGGRPAVKKYGYVVRGKHVIAQIEGMSRDAIKLVFTAEYHDPDLRLLFRPGSSLIYGPSVTLLEA